MIRDQIDAVLLVIAVMGLGACSGAGMGNQQTEDMGNAVSVSDTNHPDTEVDLAKVIQFSDPKNCDKTETFASIFDAMLEMVSADANGRPIKPIFVKRLDRHFMPRVLHARQPGSSELIEVILPLAGGWRDLHVKGLMTSAPDGSDFISELILFSDTPDRVRTVLNKEGFNLPPLGKWRETHVGEETPGSISIKVEKDGSSLLCQ